MGLSDMAKKRVVSRTVTVTVCDALVADAESESTFHYEGVVGGVVSPTVMEKRVQDQLDQKGYGMFKLVRVCKVWNERRHYVMSEERFLGLATCDWVE